MTCPKCQYQWCWLCGATFKEDHFDKWNLFGCRNLQFDHVTKCRTINSIVCTMLLIPFILLFRPVVILFKIFSNPLYAPQQWRWCCPFQRWAQEECNGSCCRKLWLLYVIYVIICPCILVLGLVLGSFNIIIFALPAFFYQSVRLLRVLFYRCPCFVK